MPIRPHIVEPEYRHFQFVSIFSPDSRTDRNWTPIPPAVVRLSEIERILHSSLLGSPFAPNTLKFSAPPPGRPQMPSRPREPVSLRTFPKANFRFLGMPITPLNDFVNTRRRAKLQSSRQYQQYLK